MESVKKCKKLTNIELGTGHFNLVFYAALEQIENVKSLRNPADLLYF